MATERFIDITVRSDSAERNINNLDRRMTGLGRTADSAVRTLGKLTKVAAAVAVAVAAAATATAAMVKSSADARRETEQLARLVKVSAEEFNALTFATKQYGISAEQIADISKDIADRVGEFTAAGTGTFQDYVDVLKLTEEAAAEAAKEFQFMSGPAVIQKMVNEMEKANVTGAQMTFVLESMGNDLSLLQPLFANNGAEIKRLTGGFNALNSELAITAQQSDDLKRVSENFDLMAGSAQASSLAISAALAPALNNLFDSIINTAPTATKLILELINSIIPPADIKSINAIDDQMQALNATILELRNSTLLGFDTSQMQSNLDMIERIEDKLSKLAEQREKLVKIGEVSGGGVTGGAGDDAGVTADNKKLDAAVAFFDLERRATERHLRGILDLESEIRTEAQIAEEERFFLKAQRLITRNEAEKLALGTNNEAKKELQTAFDAAEAAALEEHEKLLTDIKTAEDKKRTESEAAALQKRLSLGAQAIVGFASLSKKGQKLAQRVQQVDIIRSTAVAVTKSFENAGGFPLGIPAALAMAAAGAVQLKAVGGGGGIASPTGSGGVAQQAPTATAQDLPQQTRAIDIRIDDNALLTGAMFKEALNSVLESDSDIAINITNAQEEAVRTGAI